MSYVVENPDYAKQVAAQLGMASAKAPAPATPLDETVKMLNDALNRTRSARRRVGDAADKLFGSVPESPVGAMTGSIGCEMPLSTLIRDLHDELTALEHQVGRL